MMREIAATRRVIAAHVLPLMVSMVSKIFALSERAVPRMVRNADRPTHLV